MAKADLPTLYRYEVLRTEHDLRLRLCTFPADKETPKGWWIQLGYKKRRWIAKKGKKKFAHLTKAEAWESLRARKRRQRDISRAQLGEAEALLNNMTDEPPEREDRFRVPFWYEDELFED